MKIGVSLYSYGSDIHAGRMSVRDAIDHAASLGCDGIEIIAEQHLPNWGRPQIPELEELSAYIRDRGLEIANFSCYLNDRPRTDRAQTHEELVATAKQSIELAHIMGARIIRPVYLNLSEVKGAQDQEVAAQRQQKLIDIISACLPLLEQKNMVWALEIHAPFPPDYYHDVIRAVHSPHVGLLPDFSCWQTAGLPSEYQNNSIDSFKALLPDVVHCHGKAHVFDDAGEEPNTPYASLLGALKAADYRGYVVAEFEGWWEKPADSREMVAKHFNLLKRYQ